MRCADLGSDPGDAREHVCPPACHVLLLRPVRLALPDPAMMPCLRNAHGRKGGDRRVPMEGRGDEVGSFCEKVGKVCEERFRIRSPVGDLLLYLYLYFFSLCKFFCHVYNFPKLLHETLCENK